MTNKFANDTQLEKKIEILICLGAATAANCIPCFEHLYEKAQAIGLTADEIRQAADLAAQVKKGAHFALQNSMNDILGIDKQYDLPCGQSSKETCCG
jgi:alkylhydroperoxidase/carboxymuconolactone decarboxylase family protein YurZ